MPSMKCYNCGKVKRCKMVVTRHPDDTKPQTEYLCAPCARELGYAADYVRSHPFPAYVDEGGES